MNKTFKNILKILLIGLITTIVRIIGQLSIPAGEQTVLEPSAVSYTHLDVYKRQDIQKNQGFLTRRAFAVHMDQKDLR